MFARTTSHGPGTEKTRARRRRKIRVAENVHRSREQRFSASPFHPRDGCSARFERISIMSRAFMKYSGSLRGSRVKNNEKQFRKRETNPRDGVPSRVFGLDRPRARLSRLISRGIAMQLEGKSRRRGGR